MNMIQKTFDCARPVSGLDYVQEYQVSAWMAMGSDVVNYRLRDGLGWHNYGGLMPEATSEKLSDYAKVGIRSMDDLIEYLFYVVKG